MPNESKVVQIGSIHLPNLTNDAHFMYMKDVEKAIGGAICSRVRITTIYTFL